MRKFVVKKGTIDFIHQGKISFFVPGVPRPGGSKNAFHSSKTGKTWVADSCKDNPNWRADIKTIVLSELDRLGVRGVLMDAPIRLRVRFVMPRPKAHYKKDGTLKPNAPVFHIKDPDTTKLLRALEDALTGIVWWDDNRVCQQFAEKFYVGEGEVIGAHITIECIRDEKEEVLLWKTS